MACREPCPRGPYGPGGMLGVLEMLGELPTQHTPAAETDCILLRITAEELLSALDTHRDLTMELLAEASRRLLGSS
jgi:CRP-like cAMP-binding protein